MAEPLTIVSGAAAPLLRDNVDTDAISPGSRRGGSGAAPGFSEHGSATLAADLFANWRYDDFGAERPEFILNRAPFRQAKFLLAGANFGCGSSRESAVWMLKAWGMRCIIAPSFSDIFANSCFANGLLPLVLPASLVAELAVEADPGAPAAMFRLDVEAGELATPAGRTIHFQLAAFRRRALLHGLDEIGVTLEVRDTIEAFLTEARTSHPWAYPAEGGRVRAT